MPSEGRETCRLISPKSFRLAGPTQPGLPNGQTPHFPVSFEAASGEEKPHVMSSTVLVTMNAVTASLDSPSKQGCERGRRGRKEP